jgi:hypothetical protein
METVIVKDLSTDSSAVTVSEKSPKGRAGLVWRNDWIGTANYYVGDAVLYLGSSYICKRYIAANASGFPSLLTDDWHLLSSQGSSGNVTSTDVGVAAYNNMPAGNLQDALEHLEDQLFKQTAAPTVAAGDNLEEGDLWYDTTNNRMNVYRNNTWEILVTGSALSADTGYDNISMDGGFF